MSDRFKDIPEFPVIFLLQIIDALLEVPVLDHEFAQAGKHAHDVNVDIDGTITVKNAGEHGDALLGKGIGEGGGMFKRVEPVAICDQFIDFPAS